ncbi:hypothetical protein SDC9_102683 [bioreactor metagenome]|uniref:Uncharacterized protein n=1 Tax=bioreactor metagenome TaxID=1076179 RepID=A0A645ARH9_9ZZZZ
MTGFIPSPTRKGAANAAGAPAPAAPSRKVPKGIAKNKTISLLSLVTFERPRFMESIAVESTITMRRVKAANISHTIRTPSKKPFQLVCAKFIRGVLKTTFPKKRATIQLIGATTFDG